MADAEVKKLTDRSSKVAGVVLDWKESTLQSYECLDDGLSSLPHSRYLVPSIKIVHHPDGKNALQVLEDLCQKTMVHAAQRDLSLHALLYSLQGTIASFETSGWARKFKLSKAPSEAVWEAEKPRLRRDFPTRRTGPPSSATRGAAAAEKNGTTALEVDGSKSNACEDGFELEDLSHVLRTS